MLIVLGRASSYRCWFRTRKFCHKKYIMACIMKYFIQENSCEKKAHMEIFKTLKVCLQFAVTNNTFSCIQKWLKNLGNICLETRLRYQTSHFFVHVESLDIKLFVNFSKILVQPYSFLFFLTMEIFIFKSLEMMMISTLYQTSTLNLIFIVLAH